MTGTIFMLEKCVCVYSVMVREGMRVDDQHNW